MKNLINKKDHQQEISAGKRFSFGKNWSKYLKLIDEKKIQHFYPECCDYEFCNLLKFKGVLLDFKIIDKDRPPKTYYCILYEELKNKIK